MDRAKEDLFNMGLLTQVDLEDGLDQLRSMDRSVGLNE